MKFKVEPKYQHDCPTCVFLGRDEETDTDLYIHMKAQGTLPTLIARSSDNGPDYESGPPQYVSDGPRVRAKQLAIEKGLLAADGEPELIPPPSQLHELPKDLKRAAVMVDEIYRTVSHLGMESNEVLQLVKAGLYPSDGWMDSDRRLLEAFVTFINECIEENRDDS